MSDIGTARGWQRHLEGWEAGAAAVFLAASIAVVAVPRPIEPTEIPEPRVNPAALRAVAAEDARLAALGGAEPLDVDVRLLGSSVRSYGLLEAAGDAEGALLARGQVIERARAAAAHGDEPLLRLRALQLRSFRREVARWEATGVESDELRELGGGFVRRLRESGWVDGLPGRERAAPDDASMAALFKKRWGEVTAISGPAFEPTLDERRALARFQLRRPPAPADPIGVDRTRQEQYRLKKIDEIAAFDDSYPADFARGVTFYRLGLYGVAVQKLHDHLERAPDGPLTLRAQNHLRAALLRAQAEQF